METLVNFRELGGKKNKHGKEVKRGKIFRSGELFELSEADKNDLVHTHKMKTIFDFRGGVEAAEKPDDIFQTIKYQHIDILKDSAGRSSGLKDIISSDFSASETMARIYTNFIRTQSSLQGYKLFIEMIAEDETAPFIFHCFAGKDRTGIGAALILGILEVSKEDILEDYLETNICRKKANDALLKKMKKEGFSDARLIEVEQMLYVRKEYLEITYETMREDYHDFDNFIKNGLQLDEAVIKKIRELYLIP